MRSAEICLHGTRVGVLNELDNGHCQFQYDFDYAGAPVSVTMPVKPEPYNFGTFPPFFDGLLPEGLMLEALLRQLKIDRRDSFAQLCAVGGDLVGAVTVEQIP